MNFKKNYEKKVKKIFALFNENTIRVYQAYNKEIADEALQLGTFGESFKLERMTWIKPSFLWMMYRSEWGTKKDQEKILAIDILREGFDSILSKAVLSSFDPKIYLTISEWKQRLQLSEVRCQWDPDRDTEGNPLEERAIQLGIRGSIVNEYINKWIIKITDITENVHKLKKDIDAESFSISSLPIEREYPVEEYIKRSLGME